jgi:hypothetical protein
MHTHAASEIPAWIPDEALRHQDMPLRLGGVPIRERGEVSGETSVVRRLCPRDQLSNLQVVQESGRPLLRNTAGDERQDGQGREQE